MWGWSRWRRWNGGWWNGASALSGELADDERDGKTDAEDVNDQLGEEGFGRERTLGRGGDRDDDAAHHQMNGAAVDDAAEKWRVDEGRQLAADQEIDESSGEGNEEVEEEARDRCFRSLLEC